MKQQIDEILGRVFAGWVDAVRRRARLVITLNLLATLALAIFTETHLGVNMDNKQLIDEDLPFWKAAVDFSRYFPSLDDSLLIVIDSESPEIARAAATALRGRLKEIPERFSDVYASGAESFFERRGLLYRTPEELDDFADHMARMQPVIADLSRNGSIANLARLVRLGLEQERARGEGAEAWSAVLDRVGDATVRVFDEYPISISWERLMLKGSAFDQGTRQVVIAEPILEFGKLLPATGAMAEIRKAARGLSLVPERGVHVRITGNPALNYEEMLGLAWDVGFSEILSLVLVTAVLFWAYRSLRLVAAAALTLVVGLVWTAAFAAASVGHLNVLSIAFGVLFIGLGVDFQIHLGMQYVDVLQRGASSADALGEAARRVGSSLVICAVTTAIGFFAFVPTDYRGVAELGLISGTGMFVILFQTVTLFPALITVLLGEEASARLGKPLRLRLTPPRVVTRHPGTVVLVSLGVGLLALSQLPRLRFDINVITMRDPRTESVQAFEDLLKTSGTSPWHANAVAPDLARAELLGKRFRDLDVVKTTLTLSDYVPSDQQEKLDILADVALLLDTPRGEETQQSMPSVEEQIAALEDLHQILDASWLRELDSPLGVSAQELRDELGRFLARVEKEDDPAPALADLEEILLGRFPEQVERLQLALEPPAITLEDLPKEISKRMLARDGHARVQVFPREDLSDTTALVRFVDAVRSVDPNATGVAVNLVEFGRATMRSLRQALLFAFLAIALLLALRWRRLTEMALVLSPLVLAAGLTAAFMVMFDLPFNFTNVVVLPLLLGVGVDSGIHLVHRSQVIRPDEGDLLETTTARAVFFSAVTTIASFGTLALSRHCGLASMGLLLVSGMVITLASNLIVLPALIELLSVYGVFKTQPSDGAEADRRGLGIGS